MIKIERLKISDDNNSLNIKASFPVKLTDKTAVLDDIVFTINDDLDEYVMITVNQTQNDIASVINVGARKEIVVGTTNMSAAYVMYVISQNNIIGGILKIRDEDVQKSFAGGSSAFTRTDCYGNMRIDYVFISTQKNFSANFTIPTAIDNEFIGKCLKEGIFVRHLTDSEKDEIISEIGLDIYAQKDFAFEGNLLFVYLHSSDNPQCDTEECDRCFSFATTYNETELYRIVLDSLNGKIDDCCNYNVDYADVLLEYFRLVISLKAECYSDAADAWKILHMCGNERKSVKTKCGCNGQNDM